jgi:hypothetical protein
MSKESRDIYGFIHVGVMNDWKRILDSQIESLKSSGLMLQTKKIYVSGAGDMIDLPEGMELGVWTSNLKEGEVETMKFIHCMSKEVSGNFWYIHTKGARWEIGSHESKCADSWREYMQYFVIRRWKHCVDALKTHDVCGVEYTESQWALKMDFIKKFIFSGNFWWARSDYIESIVDPIISENPYDEYRYKAEFFIVQGNPKIKNFHQLHPTGDLYGILIQPKLYKLCLLP